MPSAKSSESFPFFDFGRNEKFPTIYKEQHTPAFVDVITTGIITCWVILGISFFSILPAYGKNDRISLFLRVTFSLLIGGIILVCQYGHNWEIGTQEIITPYKPLFHEEIKGKIGLHVTLRGINITLIGEPFKHHANESSELEHERIDYNEHFSWEWAQGRLGFGYYAGQISKDFRSATMRGVPLPILQVAEYFTFDGEGIRFGRYYRLAGWYTHLLLWAAFGTWIVSNILFCMIISSGAYFLMITGALQLMGIAIWTYHRNPIEIQVPFQSAESPKEPGAPYEEVLLKTYFGPDYYAVFGNGILCILLSVTIVILNILKPDEMCTFFGIDPLTIYDEVVMSKDELQSNRELDRKNRTRTVFELQTLSDLEKEEEQPQRRRDDQDQEDASRTVVLKRKTDLASDLFRSSFRVKPRPKPRRQMESHQAPEGFHQPLLSRTRTGESSDEESTFSWPPPPRDSQLRRPPTPPRRPI